MNHVIFDKLAYVDALKSGGFTAGQARIQANALEDALRETVATKHDILSLEKHIQLLEQRLVIKMGLMIFALGGFLSAMKYFG